MGVALRIEVPTSDEPVAPSVPARSGGTPLSQGTHVQLEEALISAFRSPEQVNEFLSYRLDRSSACTVPKPNMGCDLQVCQLSVCGNDLCP